MKEDVIDIEVMPDGLIKIITPKISSANHASAGEMIDFIARMAGGQTTVTPRTKSLHTHSHEKAKGQA